MWQKLLVVLSTGHIVNAAGAALNKWLRPFVEHSCIMLTWSVLQNDRYQVDDTQLICHHRVFARCQCQYVHIGVGLDKSTFVLE